MGTVAYTIGIELQEKRPGDYQQVRPKSPEHLFLAHGESLVSAAKRAEKASRHAHALAATNVLGNRREYVK